MEGTEEGLPILKKSTATEDDLPILKKKAVAEAPSAQVTTPSNQALGDAPTTTTPALEPTNQESSIPSLPLAGSTSVSAPSTSASSQKSNTPPQQKVSQNILNAVVDKHAYGLNDDQKKIFFTNLEKRGYSKEQVEAAKASHKAFIEDVKNTTSKVISDKNEKAPSLAKLGIAPSFDPFGPIVDWGVDFANKTGEAIVGGLDKFKGGVEEVLGSLGSQTGNISDKASEVTHGGLKAATGGAQVAFNVIPAAITFNAGMDAINTTAKKNLSEENAKAIEDLTALPFMIASKTAEAIGITPKEGSNSAMVLELLNFAIAGKAMHSVVEGKVPFTEKIKSIDDLKDITKKAAEDKLTPDESVELKKYAEDLSKVNLEDIKEQAKLSDTPEAKAILDKIDGVMNSKMAETVKKYVEVPNEEIVAASKEGETPESLRAKAGVIEKNLESGLEVNYSSEKDQAGNEYYFETDTKTGDKKPITADEYVKQTQILEQQKQSLSTQAEQLRKTADAMEAHDVVAKEPQKAIDDITSNDLLSPEEKQVAIDKITNSAELDNAYKNVEDAKIQHIKDIHAISNPGTSEFYDLAESAISDQNVLPRVKSSMEAAVQSGEITAEEAQANLDGFRERIKVQEVINPSIKDVESRMSAADLIEKKNKMEERLRTLKSYIPPVPEATILEKEKAIETVNEQLNDILSKSKEIEKARKEKENAGGQEPPVTTEDNTPDYELPADKTRAVWKRVLGNLKDQDLKDGIEKEGVSYLIKKEAITESSAKSVLDAAIESDNLPSLEKVVIDDANKMDPSTRGVLSAMLGKHYFELAEKETDVAAKQKHYDEFYKYTDKAAALATEGGQVGNAIGKVIKKMYANNPETIIAKLKKGMDESNDKKLEKADASKVYESIKEILATEEGQAAVTEQIAKQSERLFGKETQKKIIDLFDKAKIDTKGKVFDASIGLPVSVYNGAVEVMKQAALLGAKGADIIAEGIAEIRKNHKEEWDEKAFREQWEKDLKDSGVKFGKKRSVSEKQEASILDVIEKKANRLNAKNKAKFLKDIVQEVSTEGGLSEQRFKDLYAEALELPSLSIETIEKINGYAKIIKDGQIAESSYLKALDKLIDAEQSGKSSEEIKALEKEKTEALKKSIELSLEAKKANDELSIMMKGNKNLADTWIGMMQLGALTPASLIKNITAMPAELAFRMLSTPVVGATDYLITKLAETGMLPESFKERKVDTIARSKGAILASPKAFKKMFDTVLHGSFSEDFTSREITNKITPVRALKNIFDGKTHKEASALAANIVEALPQGYLASAMGRALAGPDALFRTYGEQSKAYELGTMEGLKGHELERFMADPPPEALKKIIKAGDEITFQQDNMITEMISGAKGAAKRFAESKREGEIGKFDKALLGAARVLAKSEALYIKTPTNVLGSVIRMISPEYSIAQAAREMIKGGKADKEIISKKLADAAVGYALRYVIVSAIQKGMVTPTVDYKSKEGAAQSDLNIKHGGKFNKSAYWRMLTGGDWKEQNDDIWADYSKWTGGLGITVGAYAQMLDGMPSNEINQMTAIKNSYKVLPTVLQQVMDLSFMSTMAQLVDAIRDGKGIQKWVTGTVGTLATPLLPNTASTTIKASSDTKKETRSKNILENIVNDFDYKLTGGKDLPSKVSLWGERVATAPAGANKYLYYLFDVAKAENPDENSIGYKVLDLYSKTRDERFIPTAPSNQITISGKKVTLDGNQFEELQRYVGGIRKQLATEYMNSDSFADDNDNDKAYKLQRIYSKAHKMGVDMITASDDHLTDIKNDESQISPVTGNRRTSRKRKTAPTRKGRKNN